MDVVMVVSSAAAPLPERAANFDATALPVPADVIVHTENEFDKLLRDGSRMGSVLVREARWVYEAG